MALLPPPPQVSPLAETDVAQRIASKVAQLTDADAGYWDCVEQFSGPHAPKYFQYPAMMVPAMQGKLLDVISGEWPTEQPRAWDPFSGSGVVLAEGMWRGWDIVATDINPLSNLICSVRQGPHRPQVLEGALKALERRLGDSTVIAKAPRWKGWTKWFRPQVRQGVRRVQAAIRLEPRRYVRRLWWIALAEVVRLCSNSRTSTYKLHKRPDESLSDPAPNVRQMFLATASRFVESYTLCANELSESNLLYGGQYRKEARVRHLDVRDADSSLGHFDFVITSPPYGDNASTVPYGQASFLALQLIDAKDLPTLSMSALLENTYSIDTASLGGSKKGALDEVESLATRSPTLQAVFDNLEGLPHDRKQRVSAFYRDMYQAMEAIVRRVKPGGLFVLTLGSRTVGGVIIDMPTVMEELGEQFGLSFVAKANRKIRFKKMASRNNQARTMDQETILILRRTTTPTDSQETITQS